MKKQWLITLLLLVGALNLYLLIQIDQQDSREQEELANLTQLDPEQISSIRIVRENGQILFNKETDNWVMREPRQGPADAERMTELRAMAVITPLAKYDIAQVDLARYGLSTPQLTVYLNDTQIAFGNVNPANGRRYVLSNNRLFLIADNIFPILQLPAEQFLQ
ncbi:MAG: DUF4340 domain-containing protein [Gammaproteobacteria bacterium]|nr:DUF4340 domain-containing protein [Gammaproteobacteria bacterium]